MNWTPEQEKRLKNLVAAGINDSELATTFEVSEAAIRGKRQRLGLVDPSAPVPFATFEEDLDQKRGEYWREQYRQLEKKYEKALRHTSVIEQLVERAAQLAPRSYQPAPEVIAPRRDHSGSPQSAILLLSDTHVGQVVSPDQTLGFGKYDFETFLTRLKFVEDAVLSILRDHTTTAVPELIVCLGGDMLHGALNHNAEVAQHVTLFSQFYGAGHALAQFLRNLSAHVPIRIQTVVGNHTRWGNQHKMPTKNRFSNLDQFLYAYIHALTRDISRIRWTLDMQPFSLFYVQNFFFHLSHGDHLRGGDKALGIPNHAVGRMVSSTTQLFGKRDQPSPHYYLTGHLHRDIVLPHARGNFIVNGGFAGIDDYGLAEGFSPVDPTQTFFLVHPKYGRTATYQLQLRFAEVTNQRPYLIPEGFDLR